MCSAHFRISVPTLIKQGLYFVGACESGGVSGILVFTRGWGVGERGIEEALFLVCFIAGI